MMVTRPRTAQRKTELLDLPSSKRRRTQALSVRSNRTIRVHELVEHVMRGRSHRTIGAVPHD